MRSYLALSTLAGLLCAAPLLPSQSNWPGTFSFLTDSGARGSRLGVGLRDIDPDRANVIKLGDPRGVEVMTVEDSSPAEQAGIKVGDVLLSYNGEIVVGAQQLGRLVAETPRGRKVKIEYWRDGKVSTITATTAAPSNRIAVFPAGPDLDVADLPRVAFAGSIPMPHMIWQNPRLGIECEALDSQLAEFFGVKRGVLVRSVTKDSPAAKAGVHAGDVITQMGDRSVADPKDIMSYLRAEQRSNQALSLEVMREHKPLTMKVALRQGDLE